MIQAFNTAIKPLNDQLGKALSIPVVEEFDQTEEGPEVEYQVYVRVDKDWNIKSLLAYKPF